ncbi:ABC transporter permease [Paenibacillus puerhi]|uniref:ABC transporter permease n=1 Tax=Paenibacillus puerhi TaxID=2692622 RepID=UPI001358B2F2|nr:ABC transporter permease [Paenibacillus puerhi]
MIDIASETAVPQKAVSRTPDTLIELASERRSVPWSRRRSVTRLVSVLSPLLLLAIWEASSRLGAIDARFFPAPTTVLANLLRLFESGEMWLHLGISLRRIAIGFLWGALPGVVLGLIMGLSPLIRAAIMPLVNATFPVPKLALLPLILIIFGIGETSKVMVIAISVVYLTLINTLAGVTNIPGIYLDVGRNFQAGRWLFFRDVALPGALPLILTGLKLGMGIALLVIMAAEFVGAKSGVGYFIWSSWNVFAVQDMYAGLMVIAMLGGISTVLLDALEQWIIPWRR